jgi:hypothetical protein
MVQELVALGPAGTETEMKRNIVQAVKETAKHLGNRRQPVANITFILPFLRATSSGRSFP